MNCSRKIVSRKWRDCVESENNSTRKNAPDLTMSKSSLSSILHLQLFVYKISTFREDNSQHVRHAQIYSHSEDETRKVWFVGRTQGSDWSLNHSVLSILAFTIDRLLRGGRVSMAPQSVLHSVRTSGQANGRFLFLDRDTGPGIVSKDRHVHRASLPSPRVVPSRAY